MTHTVGSSGPESEATVTVCSESETRSSRVSPRLQTQPTRYRVTLPPCETDGSSGHSNPQASINQITKAISGSVGMSSRPTPLPWPQTPRSPRAPSAQLPRTSGNHSNLKISANTPEPQTPPPSAWSHCSRLQLAAQQRTINLRSRLQS